MAPHRTLTCLSISLPIKKWNVSTTGCHARRAAVLGLRGSSDYFGVSFWRGLQPFLTPHYAPSPRAHCFGRVCLFVRIGWGGRCVNTSPCTAAACYFSRVAQFCLSALRSCGIFMGEQASCSCLGGLPPPHPARFRPCGHVRTWIQLALLHSHCLACHCAARGGVETAVRGGDGKGPTGMHGRAAWTGHAQVRSLLAMEAVYSGAWRMRPFRLRCCGL